MFETSEPPEHVVDRRWQLLFYGVFLLAGLVYVVFGLRRHGFSQPISLAIGVVMFFLSLTWVVTTLRSTYLLTNREFGVRVVALVLLQMAQELPSLFR